jgi:glucosamine--fructose-6-phosphate aminotransferase (isomerizing)
LLALERLEYRGYDSAGIGYIDPKNRTNIKRTVGQIQELVKLIDDENDAIFAQIGIGHTRWATHGEASVRNAHPHHYNGISIVHNGIIENYAELKDQLIRCGHVFSSETDSEVIAHVIQSFTKQGYDFSESFKRALRRFRGSYAIVAMSEEEPGVMVCAKYASPLVFGFSGARDKVFVASDAIALSSLADDVSFLEDGETIVCVAQGGNVSAAVYDSNDCIVKKKFRQNIYVLDKVSRCNYEDFMLKEIFEESVAALDTFRSLDSFSKPKYDRVCFVACGTSYYAGLIAKYWIEDLERICVDVEIASEFRYRNPVLSDKTLYVFISQSGETIDTLGALNLVKEKNLKTVAIVNTAESSIAREADISIFTKAGVEIGVASTKTLVAQMVAILSVFVAKDKFKIDDIVCSIMVSLAKKHEIEEIAKNLADAKQMLYVGRWASYPVALEGALKMKELSYIGAEGFPSGEMKHGPIALVDSSIYTVVLAPNDRCFDKTLSNTLEILARKGKIIMVCNDDSEQKLHHLSMSGDVCFISTKSNDAISNSFGMLSVLHLLAYYTAKYKHLNVDKPRNLAKSVTVE